MVERFLLIYCWLEGKLVLLPCSGIWQDPLNLRMCKFCQPATLPVSIWLRKCMHMCTRKQIRVVISDKPETRHMPIGRAMDKINIFMAEYYITALKE